MQDDFPLTLQYVRRGCATPSRARGGHADAGGDVRASFGEVVERIDRLARALRRSASRGATGSRRSPGTPSATSSATSRFPASARYCTRSTCACSPSRSTYIINHAEDRVVFVDDSLVPLLEPLAPTFEPSSHFVVMGDGRPANARCPRAALRGAARGGRRRALRLPGARRARGRRALLHVGHDRQPQGRPLLAPLERAARAGVADGGHRSALAAATACWSSCRCSTSTPGGCRTRRRCAAPSCAARPPPQAEPLARADQRERATVMGCVPTIYADLLRYADAHSPTCARCQCGLRRLGGAARAGAGLRGAPRRAHLQAWGMTETSPLCTRRDRRRGRGHEERSGTLRATQGRPLPFVELRLVDDDGEEVAVGRGVDRRDRGAGAVDRQRATTATTAARSSTAAGCAPATSRTIDAHGFVQDHRPLQGRDQVRRRVDLLGRARERADGPPRRARGGGDRHARRALGRAAAGLRRARARAPRVSAQELRRAPRRARGEVVAARRVRVHRRGPEDERRQVRQEGAARAPARGALEGRVSVGAHPPSPASPAVSPGS